MEHSVRVKKQLVKFEIDGAIRNRLKSLWSRLFPRGGRAFCTPGTSPSPFENLRVSREPAFAVTVYSLPSCSACARLCAVIILKRVGTRWKRRPLKIPDRRISRSLLIFFFSLTGFHFSLYRVENYSSSSVRADRIHLKEIKKKKKRKECHFIAIHPVSKFSAVTKEFSGFSSGKFRDSRLDVGGILLRKSNFAS